PLVAQSTSGSATEKVGAAISIAGAWSSVLPGRRAEPGANSARADIAKTEKAEATASCLDIVFLFVPVAARYALRASFQRAMLHCDKKLHRFPVGRFPPRARAPIGKQC